MVDQSGFLKSSLKQAIAGRAVRGSWWAAISTLLLLALRTFPSIAQDIEDRYASAGRFSAQSLASKIFGGELQPHWIGAGSRFWYSTSTRDGRRFLVVDIERGIQREALNLARLKNALAKLLPPRNTHTLENIEALAPVLDQDSLRLTWENRQIRCTLSDYRCTDEGAIPPPPWNVLGHWWRKSRAFPIASRSPDGKWTAYLKNHNLFVRTEATGEEIQLTFDGTANNDYVAALPNPKEMVAQGKQDIEMPVSAIWSPDSTKILAYRLDRRSASTLTIVQSSPPGQIRPKTYTYTYPLAGDRAVPQAEPVLVDVARRQVEKLAVEPIPVLYYSDFGPYFEWSTDSRRIWYLDVKRGYQQVELREIDATNAMVRPLITESSSTQIDREGDWRMLGGGKEFLWLSEQSGWRHLSLHDGASGALKSDVTSGTWAVRELLYVDERARIVYFTAGGREPGRDPYFRHLYRVGLDGRQLKLLTPENADHQISFSPDRKFFLDAYSRVDLPPVSLIRRTSDGSVVCVLQRADIEALHKMNWKSPEPFVGTAADEKTEIYGAIWKPSNFDPGRKYPVIEYNYTGPQGAYVPKRFERAFKLNSLAELGFIVVMLDGRGLPYRSRDNKDFSFHNLGGVFDDHVAWIRQAARSRPYMDLQHVGIYGASHGGYGALRAMLQYPDFYRVGVAIAGDHDFRLDKAQWPELWMGFPLDAHYEEQSNVTQAHRLTGKLLLIHGELDENVPLAATLQVANALISADKDFDLLIVPNGFHASGADSYVSRKLMDYFVRHLQGVEPPDRSSTAESTRSRP